MLWRMPRASASPCIGTASPAMSRSVLSLLSCWLSLYCSCSSNVVSTINDEVLPCFCSEQMLSFVLLEGLCHHFGCIGHEHTSEQQGVLYCSTKPRTYCQIPKLHFFTGAPGYLDNVLLPLPISHYRLLTSVIWKSTSPAQTLFVAQDIRQAIKVT